jgi:hypothetical protein
MRNELSAHTPERLELELGREAAELAYVNRQANPSGGTQVWNVEEYRRCLTPIRPEIPVLAFFCPEQRIPSYDEGMITDMGVYGALLVLPTIAEVGDSLLLINSKNQQEIQCHVRCAGESEVGRKVVGVEFAADVSDFWGIGLPHESSGHSEQDFLDGTHPARPAVLRQLQNPVAVGSAETIAELRECINACAKAGMGTANLAALTSSVHDIRESDTPKIVSRNTDQSRLAFVPGHFEMPPKSAEPAGQTAAQQLRKSATHDSSSGLAEIQKCISACAQEISQSQESMAKLKTKTWRLLALPILLLMAFAALLTLGLTFSPRLIARLEAAVHPAASTETWTPAAQSVAHEDASLIPEVDSYRLATSGDFDPEGVLWLRTFGQQMGGAIPGTYSASGRSHAYVLVGKDDERRVVILADGTLRCDARYKDLALAARIPNDVVRQIQWAQPLSFDPVEDGLLLVKDANNAGSGVVLFLRGDQVVSATPANFHQIPLGQTR